MNSWELIFLQSHANNGPYDGDRLPPHHWHWPQGTWFQKRRHDLRHAGMVGGQESSAVSSAAFSPAAGGAFEEEGFAVRIPRIADRTDFDLDLPGASRENSPAGVAP